MKRSDIRKLVLEHLRTRFSHPQETPTLDEAPEIVAEPEDDGPGAQAAKLGLIDKRFGRYADPQTGKIVAHTVDGKLVKCEPRDAEEDMQAPEPKISGYNSDDPYGADYPAPRNQLGAVPPKFKPVRKPVASDDFDPYTDAGSQNLSAGRSAPLALGKVIGKDAAQGAVSRSDALSPEQKDAASTGGAGTFKGHVPTDGTVLRPSPDGASASWSVDGPMDTPETDNLQKRQGVRAAAAMIQKYGSKEKALGRCRENLDKVTQEFNLLQKHNSNSTGARLTKLEKMQETIDRLRACEAALSQ